jgi:outer membrane protein assembly factor BamB
MTNDQLPIDRNSIETAPVNETPIEQTHGKPTARRPLRLWPGVAAAVLLLLGRFVVPFVMPELALYGLLAGALAVLAIVVWWLFFSRAPWLERIGALLLIIVAMIVTKRLVHESIAGGAMGFLIYVLAVPVFGLVLVAWAWSTREFSNKVRRASFLVAVLLVCVGFTSIRTGGFTAEFDNDFHWRWTKTPEERLLASNDEPAIRSTPATITTASTEWPGFRGAHRDGIVRGSHIKTDWSNSPPVELWRRPIGPAWSSFAVHGDLVYTQEQRGSEETVACYDLKTGRPVWRHGDTARFYESNGGPGPRGTPTLSNGRVYTLGATGILNVLDAATGKVIWSRNAASDTGAKLPGWGFAGSPLVVNNLVVVATAGKLAAYDLATGEPRWYGPDGGGGYSSPHLATVQGVEQILLLNGAGAVSVAPNDGKKLWEHALSSFPRILQPAVTAEGDVLIQEGEGTGLRRIAVSQGQGGWTVAERWFTEGLNPYFNDFVIHKGYVYGVDSNGIACIDLKEGNRKWKGGRYGSGQLILLADQDLLLVIGEQGELALVKASPDQFTELARFPAIKGKTWNHPALAGDVLLVRNGEEMAAFRLPVATS